MSTPRKGTPHYNLIHRNVSDRLLVITESFDNIGYAILVVFQAMTAEGWSEIMDHLMDSQDGTSEYTRNPNHNLFSRDILLRDGL